MYHVVIATWSTKEAESAASEAVLGKSSLTISAKPDGVGLCLSG
jgi:hypothetical protein